MKNTNATWNNFLTKVFQRDVSYQVSLSILKDEEQTKVQPASLGQEMEIVFSGLQEHQVNVLENSRQPDPNQKDQQNATRFCNFCRTNGYTPGCCRKKFGMKKSR